MTSHRGVRQPADHGEDGLDRAEAVTGTIKGLLIDSSKISKKCDSLHGPEVLQPLPVDPGLGRKCLGVGQFGVVLRGHGEPDELAVGQSPNGTVT